MGLSRSDDSWVARMTLCSLIAVHMLAAAVKSLCLAAQKHGFDGDSFAITVVFLEHDIHIRYHKLRLRTAPGEFLCKGMMGHSGLLQLLIHVQVVSGRHTGIQHCSRPVV